MWPSGLEWWKEIKQIDFECAIVEKFVTDYIRVVFKLPFPFEDRPIISSYAPTNYEAAKVGGGMLS